MHGGTKDLVLCNFSDPIWYAVAQRIASLNYVNFQFPAGNGIGEFSASFSAREPYTPQLDKTILDRITGVRTAQGSLVNTIDSEITRLASF